MRLIISLLFIICVQVAGAWSADSYAASSRLAQGKWVKVSITESGLYAISRTQLKEWGFADIERVRIHGYGAAPIGQVLSAETYTDDLPMVQTAISDQGIVFYGRGPESWTKEASGVYVNNPNIYTSVAYYFVTESDEPSRDIEKSGTPQASEPAASCQQRYHYETDRISVGEAGYELVGESLTSQTRKITLNAPGGAASMQCAIVSTSEAAGTMKFVANGTALAANSTDAIKGFATTEFVHAAMYLASHQFDYTGDKLELLVSVSGLSSASETWLNYVSLNVDVAPALPQAGYMTFWLDQPQAALAAANAEAITVWDVTNPLEITQLNLGKEASRVVWTSEHDGSRAYAAWVPSAKLPAPAYAGSVSNQNIHGIASPDMVIFTPRAYMEQAKRLAQFHQNSSRPLQVTVLDVQEVYNEFASGAPTPSALRRCMKMWHDRAAATDSLSAIKYALIFAPLTYDNKHLTSQFDGSNDYPTIPTWLAGDRAAQFSDNSAYPTDDVTAMLSDDSGLRPGRDELSVAIGRLPVSSAAQAKQVVDKILKYAADNQSGTWKNNMLFIADDGDNGAHLQDTEKMIANIEAEASQQYLINKVYVDAYDIIDSKCVGGRDEMWRLLREGVLWWNFCGHANKFSWTGEDMLTYNDINNMRVSRLPILMAATCNFMRWDSRTTSGAEVLMMEPNGGTIATISATRPVYITDNALLGQAVGRSLAHRFADGSVPRIGDVYRLAKNDIRDSFGNPRNDTNRLRYALMGDPAMAMALPENVVTLDSIDGVPVDIEQQITLKALQHARLSGSVRRYDGSVITDFSGTVTLDLYDAEMSTTTRGVRDDNVEITFEQHGQRLHSGSAQVVDGRFSAMVPMPGEIKDNFRPATLNMAATAVDGRSAAGVNRDFYVFGYDEAAPSDTVAPVIDALWLNHEDFCNGDVVNPSPVVMARISDNVAINMSLAGIGHQMTITLDDNRTYTDVALYYTPSATGDASGTIAYPLSDLTVGRHTLRLRVWDTSANAATAAIEFEVREDLTPRILRVYTDANPAVDQVNFYVQHNLPEADMQVTVTVYSLMGRQVWQGRVTGQSQMSWALPVSWNLCDAGGARVPRGIYVYRVEVAETNGTRYSTASKKLAITGQ